LYLSNAKVKTFNWTTPNMFNLNIFDFKENKVDRSANQICQSVKRKNGTSQVKLKKPGTDIYLQVATELDLRNIELGRICCMKTCDCLVIARTSNILINTSLSDNTNFNLLNPGYDCNEELADCMFYCKKMFNPNMAQSELDSPASELDLFGSSLFLQFKTCADISNKRPPNLGGGQEAKFEVFLRYVANGAAQFPQTEDIYIGNLCCKPSGNQYVPC
jgi:hypothetical protein